MLPRKSFHTLATLGLVCITRAGPVHAVECDDRLANLRNQVVRLFQHAKPAPPVPAWVDHSRTIDSVWWRKILLESRERSVRELLFADGTTASLDRYLGAGADGITYAFNSSSLVIKLPRLSTIDDPKVILDEVHRSLELHRAGFTIAPVVGHSRQGELPFVIKPFVNGEPLHLVQVRTMSSAQIDGLAKIYAIGARTKVHFDLIGKDHDNIIWDKKRQDWVIVDLGALASPIYFAPFDAKFGFGGEAASVLSIYRSEVFNFDDSATLRFQAKALELLARP